MAWYILYPKSGTNKRCALRTKKPTRKVPGYGFAEGPLPTLEKVSWRLNNMGVRGDRRPKRRGRII